MGPVWKCCVAARRRGPECLLVGTDHGNSTVEFNLPNIEILGLVSETLLSAKIGLDVAMRGLTPATRTDPSDASPM